MHSIAQWPAQHSSRFRSSSHRDYRPMPSQARYNNSASLDHNTSSYHTSTAQQGNKSHHPYTHNPSNTFSHPDSTPLSPGHSSLTNRSSGSSGRDSSHQTRRFHPDHNCYQRHRNRFVWQSCSTCWTRTGRLFRWSSSRCRRRLGWRGCSIGLCRSVLRMLVHGSVLWKGRSRTALSLLK
jgi:hypothetical protein